MEYDFHTLNMWQDMDKSFRDINFTHCTLPQEPVYGSAQLQSNAHVCKNM